MTYPHRCQLKVVLKYIVVYPFPLLGSVFSLFIEITIIYLKIKYFYLFIFALVYP